MTTMVAMDSFDTPMMDYMADDVTMQIGPSVSSHSWAQPEATMEDDDPHFHTGDVEIDMEAYDSENLEYEMTDEASVNQPNVDELLDVEVFDAAENHGFPPSLIDGSDVRVADEPTSPQKSPIPQTIDAHYIQKSYSEPMLTPSTLPEDAVYPSLGPQPQDIVEAISSDVAEAQSDTYEPPLEALPIPAGTDDTLRPQEQSEPHHIQAAQADPQENHPSPVHLPFNVEVPHEESHEVENLETALVRDHVEREGARNWEDERQVDQGDALSHGSTGDPHEISEGIYIDPPPAVLLSLHPSSNTFCLFNYPETKSVTDDNGDSGLILLLHDFPTLYYEPLSKVFETLRNDGHIANSYDLANGELVIDAYELVDLTISEDNIHASEVSLHDLNILHDISDLAGPLRIRLECRGPRFIVRYRYLRSELERLNIDGEDKREAPPTITECNVERNSTEQVETHQETGEKWHQQSDPTDTNEDPPYEDQNTEQPQITENASNHDQSDQGAHPDHKHAGNEQYDDELDGELDEDADGETDYGSQLALDATEVHENLDTNASAPIGGAPTEYEEVEEDKDDYDERFGEGLPFSKDGNTVVIESDLGGDHHEEWTSVLTDEPQLSIYFVPTEGSAVVGEGGQQPNKYTGPIDLAGDADSEEAIFGDDTATSAEYETLESATNKKQVTETVPLQDDEEEGGSNYTDPSNGNLEFDLQANPDVDAFDDAEWDEDSGGELDETEHGLNGESLSTEIFSKTPLKKTSSKRSFEEVDLEEVQEESNPSEVLEVSPDPKRQKVV